MLYQLHQAGLSARVNFEAGQLESLQIGGEERLSAFLPLFRIRLRDRKGDAIVVDTSDAKRSEATPSGAIYVGFGADFLKDMMVQVWLTEENGDAAWRIAVDPKYADLVVEWVDFPLISLPPLSKNASEGKGGEILLPYNEGVLISDVNCREETSFRHWEPEYPSLGSYAIFPNMISSQMMAYLWKDCGLYVGAHDPKRGVKGIDFYSNEKGVTLQIRLFCGVEYGEPYQMEYPIIWSAVDGRWESAAQRYRLWFERALPPKVKKIEENEAIPAWYEDAPLVVSYPIRGRFDMDEMSPNAFYPYTNALPVIEEIKKTTDSRILVLLMHWEGTAPWAPPYVWPPFGDVENFKQFQKALHERKDLLGVYCSGFGYTMQSNLIAEYNRVGEYEKEGLARGMCAGPDGKVAVSPICPGQRSGHDICPASDVGRALLDEAYAPLFESGMDYVQILDQNHGGGQYFCYSREHGHPPVPGPWMTERMQALLSEWNELGKNMLFGCESAAAEPFIGHLLFSDNRYELNYRIGRPVPLYAYLYHEYVRNFMGNQVSCPFRTDEDTIRYRLAYSFAAGDCMTLVLSPDGNVTCHWGTKDFEHAPDKEKALRLVANLTRLYRQKAKDFLYAGRMIPASSVTCETICFARRDSARTVCLPAILSTAWEAKDGRRAQILVNPQDADAVCAVNGRSVTVPALDAILIEL